MVSMLSISGVSNWSVREKMSTVYWSYVSLSLADTVAEKNTSYSIHSMIVKLLERHRFELLHTMRSNKL